MTDGRTDGRTEHDACRVSKRSKPYLKSAGQGMTSLDMDERIDSLKAPFPWFGGKSRAAEIIWPRLGNVDTYNEPFAGSLAVLLSRPHIPRVETVNDLDCYLANFWRALQADPETVAYYADYPVNETDLHARHQWLVNQAEFQAAMKADPEYFDPKIAGWWVWGQCLWIGSGWCSATDKRNQHPSEQEKKPRAGDIGVNRIWHGRGHAASRRSGVHKAAIHEGHRRWQGGGQGGGSGVHAPSLLGKRGACGNTPLDDHNVQTTNGADTQGDEIVSPSAGLYDYLSALSQRLRRVRVCCGDWKRVLTPSVTNYVGLCGVLLDPPYAHDMRERCYSEDHDISADVREWAIANGDNPEFRIALCGYEGEHAMPASWECVPWKAHGGYSRTERGKENRERERIWFSPHCLAAELPLFATSEATR